MHTPYSPDGYILNFKTDTVSLSSRSFGTRSGVKGRKRFHSPKEASYSAMKLTCAPVALRIVVETEVCDLSLCGESKNYRTYVEEAYFEESGADGARSDQRPGQGSRA